MTTVVAWLRPALLVAVAMKDLTPRPPSRHGKGELAEAAPEWGQGWGGEKSGEGNRFIPSQPCGSILFITFLDVEHSHDEARYITLGLSRRNRLLLVAHTDREGVVRIISARKAMKNEQRFYAVNKALRLVLQAAQIPEKAGIS